MCGYLSSPSCSWMTSSAINRAVWRKLNRSKCTTTRISMWSFPFGRSTRLGLHCRLTRILSPHIISFLTTPTADTAYTPVYTSYICCSTLLNTTPVSLLQKRNCHVDITASWEGLNYEHCTLEDPAEQLPHRIFECQPCLGGNSRVSHNKSIIGRVDGALCKRGLRCIGKKIIVLNLQIESNTMDGRWT